MCHNLFVGQSTFGVRFCASAQKIQKFLLRWGTMYSRLDPADISAELGLDDYVASLAAKHANLEKAIQDEAQRPSPNTLSLAELKRKKLRIKDQIFLVKSRTRRLKQSFSA